MAWTASNLAQLEAAIATGARSVMYTTAAGGTNQVRYNSLQEMMNLRRVMRVDLGLETSGARSYRLASHKKGTK